LLKKPKPAPSSTPPTSPLIRVVKSYARAFSPTSLKMRLKSSKPVADYFPPLRYPAFIDEPPPGGCL